MIPQRWNVEIAVVMIYREPKDPNKHDICKHDSTMHPGDPAKVIGQERHLKLEEERDGDADKRDPRYYSQQTRRHPFVVTTQQLNDEERIKPSAQELLIPDIPHPFAQHLVVCRDLAHQNDELKKQVEVEQEKEKGSNRKERNQRQVYGEHREFDGLLAKQVLMIDRSHRDCEIGRKREE